MPKHTHDIPLRVVVQYELLQNQFLRLIGVNRGTEESFLDSSVTEESEKVSSVRRNRGKFPRKSKVWTVQSQESEGVRISSPGL